jgi:hypothetical protein
MVGLAVRLRALGTRVRVCAPPDCAAAERFDAPVATGVVPTGGSADAARSVKAAGIAFPGWDPTTSHLIAEVEMAEEPEWGLRRDALGIHSLSRLGVGVR